jgi:hypothetical protein
MHSARFRFYGSLNDFLRSRNKDSWISYAFTNIPAIKDAIEAIGIPHTEVKEIIINKQSVPFSHPLLPNTLAEVHPYIQISSAPQKFILDVHLGKLARLLRLLGFDTLYENNYTDRMIADSLKAENRIVLTRDINLLKHKVIEWGYWLRSQQPPDQLQEVLYRYMLTDKIQPFTRCLACNGCIDLVNKEEIADKLPPDTARYFNEFYQCRSCKRVYWKGSHYERMFQWIEKFKTA